MRPLAGAHALAREEARVEAQLHQGGSGSPIPPVDVAAFVSASSNPSGAEVQTRLSETSHADLSSVRALADMVLGGAGSDDDSILLETSLELTPSFHLQHLGPTLEIGFFDPETLGEGSDLLRLDVTLGEREIFGESFRKADGALAFFDGGEVQVDLVQAGTHLGSPLEIRLSPHGASAGDGFLTSLVVGSTVPEPTVLVLLGLALLALLWRRENAGAGSPL